MSKVLITGGAGFIGSHTSHRFLDANIEVVVLDAFHVYVVPIQPWFLENMNYRLTYLLQDACIRQGSTLNKDELRRVILEERPNYIVHCATLPLAKLAARQSEEAFQSIVNGTVNILEVLRDVDFVERFVYISSSMVYGDFKQIPVPEDAEKDPKDIYGGMKLASEVLTKVYARRYNIPYTIVRPSAVYGPTNSNRSVLHIFLENAFKYLPLQVIKGADTVLDFTYVKDAAEGIFGATVSKAEENQEFNITRGEGRHLNEVVDILRHHFPDLQVKEREETTSFSPRRGALDISKARRLLGYEPRWRVEEGVAEYIEFMRNFNPSITEI